MKINEAKNCIKELYLNTQSVTALISERGIGKTSAYQQCAKELGIGYINLYAAALEGPDFMGLPDKDKEHGITVYLAPQFLPTKQAIDMGLYPPKGILVLEEINRVPSDTVSVLYPLLLEKKINGHDIADGWAIGVTMNPDTMNYMVNSLDDAMIDRFISIEVTADIDDYIAYSLKNHPNEDVLAYLNACPDMLLVVKKAADSTALSKYPTPRGWTKVQELLNNCKLTDKIMQEMIAGIVGAQAAAAFFSFRKNKNVKIPSTQKLLNNYQEVKKDILELIKNRHLDVLNYVIKKVVNSCTIDDSHMINLEEFLSDLPEELQVLFFKYLSTYRLELVDDYMEKLTIFEMISDKILEITVAE